MALSQCDKCGVGGDATVVVLHGHEDVAVVTPVGGPRVLYQPVGLSVQDAVSHGEHSVVQVIRGVACQSQPISPNSDIFMVSNKLRHPVFFNAALNFKTEKKDTLRPAEDSCI